MENVEAMGTGTAKRDYGNVPTAIILMGASILISLVPVIGVIGLLVAFIAVILLFVDRAKMKPSEKNPFYASFIIYVLSIIVIVVVVITLAFSFVTANLNPSQGLTQAQLQTFIREIVPVIMALSVIIQVAYVLLPYGLANFRERLFLYVAFVISVALSFLVLVLLYNGTIALPSVPATTSYLSGSYGLSDSLIARLIGLPGPIVMCAAYLVIGMRLRRESSPGIRTY